MSTYQQALQSYVAGDMTQSLLADAVGVSQAAINRYIRGVRFPTSAVARAIDLATSGRVPFELWQSEMAARVGIATHPDPNKEAA